MTRPASEADSSIEDNEFLLGPGLLLPAVQGCERHRGAPARGHDGGYEHFSVWVAVAFRAWPSRACACRGLCSLHVSVGRTAAAGRGFRLHGPDQDAEGEEGEAFHFTCASAAA